LYSMDTIITGASGFIASGLAARLLKEGHRVLGVGRQAPKTEATPYAPLDITDFAATRALLERERPRVVYHLAALSVLQAASGVDGPRTMLETNVAGTWNVLEASRQAGVETVVVVSSDKQYGALAPPPYDDNDSTAFANGGVYELSKAQQDQVARLYAGLYESPAVRVARLGNVYGPGDRHESRIIPGTIRRTLEGAPPRITAGRAGEALREYLYLDDALEALCALAQDAQERGNAVLRRDEGKLARVAFNIGSPHCHTAAEVIQTVQRVLAEDFGIVGPAPELQPSPGGVFEPGSQFSDHSRLKTLLPGYSPRSLREGLLLTIPWYLDRARQAGR
jgi:CDP-glucose 4,6-dehydratase